MNKKKHFQVSKLIKSRKNMNKKKHFQVSKLIKSRKNMNKKKSISKFQNLLNLARIRSYKIYKLVRFIS